MFIFLLLFDYRGSRVCLSGDPAELPQNGIAESTIDRTNSEAGRTGFDKPLQSRNYVLQRWPVVRGRDVQQRGSRTRVH